MHKWQLLLTTTLVAGLAYGCESSLKLTTVLNPAQAPTESEAPSGADDPSSNSDSTNPDGEQNKDDKDLALTAPQLENAPPQVHAAAGAMNPLIFVNKGLPAASCLISPPLPTGLGIDTHNGTCRISGTPVITHPKTTHTVTAQDAGGGEGTASVDIEITAVGPPHLEDSGSQTFVTTVGGVTLPLANTGAVVVACTISPALPTGLSIAVHEGSCQISGTPTVPHPTTVHTVTASSSDGSVHSTTVTITVDAASPPVIADAGAQNYIRTVSSVSLSFSNTGSAVQSCSVSPALPAGLTLAVNAGTCRITGTPSATHASTVHTVTATAADGSQDTATVSLTVTNPPPSLADIVGTQSYVATVSAVSLSFTNSGSAVQSCSISPALPTGLSVGVHSGTCRITGTPTATQAATAHTVTATAADGTQDTATVTLSVTATDNTVPTVSNSTITATSVTSNSIAISWVAASDDVTAAADLEYKVCTGASAAAINTAGTCHSATAEMSYTANTVSYTITGKTAATTYYFNVVVQDEAGNRSVYGGITETTAAAPVPSSEGLFAAGETHTCALDHYGSGLYCWGYNTYGQIGLGNHTDTMTPHLVPTAGGIAWRYVDVGGSHTCAINENDELYCWGFNDYGQLGDGTVTLKNSPTRVGVDSDWLKVSTGINHTCALKNGGSIYCWGHNMFGAIGDGSTTNRDSPTQVGAATDWIGITAGASFTCAVNSSGLAECWGYYQAGQLGNGNMLDPKEEPEGVGIISGGDDWLAIQAGGEHACALRNDNLLYCWGSNSEGQVGNGASGLPLDTPQQVSAVINWKSFATGGSHTCAIDLDGELYCWGYNLNGQIGDGSTSNPLSPLRVGLDSDWAHVVAGRDHTCAKKVNGALYCWGSDSNGQIGNDGLLADQYTPVMISLP